jgi:hypothetical protein
MDGLSRPGRWVAPTPPSIGLQKPRKLGRNGLDLAEMTMTERAVIPVINLSPREHNDHNDDEHDNNRAEYHTAIR